MAALGRPEAVGASCALPAISRPPTGKPRRRPSVADVGRYACRLTHVEKLAELRRRLASSESRDTLQRIYDAAEELSWVVPAILHAEVSALITRIRAKRDNLFPATSKVAGEPKREAVDRGTRSMSPAIGMRSTAWEIDELGNRSRIVWNLADGPVPPSPSQQP
jgi:hypothetical protein